MPVFICNLFLHHPELCRRNICATSTSKKRIQFIFLLLCSRFILSRGTPGYRWFWGSSPRRWGFPGPFPIHLSFPFSAFFSVPSSVTLDFWKWWKDNMKYILKCISAYQMSETINGSQKFRQGSGLEWWQSASQKKGNVNWVFNTWQNLYWGQEGEEGEGRETGFLQVVVHRITTEKLSKCVQAIVKRTVWK